MDLVPLQSNSNAGKTKVYRDLIGDGGGAGWGYGRKRGESTFQNNKSRKCYFQATLPIYSNTTEN